MKKLLSILIIVITLVVCAACGAKETVTSTLTYEGCTIDTVAVKVITTWTTTEGGEIHLDMNSDPDYKTAYQYEVTYQGNKLIEAISIIEKAYNSNTILDSNDTYKVMSAKTYTKDNRVYFVINNEVFDSVPIWGHEELTLLDYVYVLINSKHVVNYSVTDSYECLLEEGYKDLRPDWSQNLWFCEESHACVAVDTTESIKTRLTSGEYVTIIDYNEGTITFSNGMTYKCYDSIPTDADCYQLWIEAGVIVGFMPIYTK